MAGRVCAIVGVSINALLFVGMIVWIVIYVVIMGMAFSSIPWAEGF